MHYGFGVGLGSETVAFAFKISAKFRIIVNLTIQHHPQRAVFIGNGLMAGAEINDAETAKPKADSRARKNAFVVGASMNDGLVHAMDQFFGEGFPSSVFEDASHAAHGVRRSPARLCGVWRDQYRGPGTATASAQC